MSVYKRPGTEFYWCKFRFNGKVIRKSTEKNTLRAAEAWERAYRNSFAEDVEACGGAGGLKDAESVAGTIADLLRADKAEAESRGLEAGTLRGLDYAHAAIRAFFSLPGPKVDGEGGPCISLPPERITYDSCTEYVASRRAAKIRGQSIVRELQCLKRVTHSARRRGWIIQEPRDWPRIKKDPKCLKRSGKFVPPEVLRAWLQTLPTNSREAALVWAVTGIRRAELERLRYDDIQDHAGRFSLSLRDEATKTGARDIPLPGIAVELLRVRVIREKAQPGDLVFGETEFNSTFRRAAMVVYGKNIHPRDLRHTVATLLARKDPVAAMRILGHRDLKTTEIYSSSTAEWMSEASEAAALTLALLPMGHSGGGTVVKRRAFGIRKSLEKASKIRLLSRGQERCLELGLADS